MGVLFTMDLYAAPRDRDIRWIAANDNATLKETLENLPADWVLEQAAVTVKFDPTDADDDPTSTQRIIGVIPSSNGVIDDADMTFHFTPEDTALMLTSHYYDLQVWVRNADDEVLVRTVQRGRIYAREDITTGTEFLDPATTVTITHGATLSGDAGDTFQLTAEVRDGDMDLLPYDVVWASNNPTVASVDQTGMVYFWTNGSAVVSATVPAFAIGDTIAVTVANGAYTPAVAGDVLTFDGAVWAPNKVTGITGVGTITVGTWNGTTVAAGFGGTGLASYAAGDIIYASGATTLVKRSIGANPNVVMTQSGGLPDWSSSPTLSGGSDAATTLTLGTGGAAPSAARDIRILLNAPDSGSFRGAAYISYLRASSRLWYSGIDQAAALGAKSAVTDFLWYSDGAAAYVAALTSAGQMRTTAGYQTSSSGQVLADLNSTHADGGYIQVTRSGANGVLFGHYKSGSGGGVVVAQDAAYIRSTAGIAFSPASATIAWFMNTSGHLVGQTDNTFDIGASAATRPRTGYFGTSLVIRTDPGGLGVLRMGSGESTAYSASDSAGQNTVTTTIELNNSNGSTNGFNQLLFRHSTDNSVSRVVSVNNGTTDTFLAFVITNTTPFEVVRMGATTTTFSVPLTVNASGSISSAGTDADTFNSIGGGGAAPTANRTVRLNLNVASDGTFPGSSMVRFSRNNTHNWRIGTTPETSGSGKFANTDFVFQNDADTFVAAITRNGMIRSYRANNATYSATSSTGQESEEIGLYLHQNSGTTNTFQQILFNHPSDTSFSRIVSINRGVSDTALAFVIHNSSLGPVEVFRLNEDTRADFFSRVRIERATALSSGTVLLELTTTIAGDNGTQEGASFNITSQGTSTTGSKGGLRVNFLPGFTGSAQTAAILGVNTAAGVASDIFDIGSNTGLGNRGGSFSATATTTGTNVGSANGAANGDINIGVFGRAIVNKTNAINIGSMGIAAQTSGSFVRIGGYFGLNTSAPTYLSSALVANNGSTTSPIFLAQDNGTTVFTIADGGAATFAAAITVSATNSVFSAGTDASTTVGIGSGGGAPTAGRSATLSIDTPHSGGNVGTTYIEFRRATTRTWQIGVDTNTSSGTKTANTDLYFYSETVPNYVVTFTGAGQVRARSGFVTVAGAAGTFGTADAFDVNFVRNGSAVMVLGANAALNLAHASGQLSVNGTKVIGAQGAAVTDAAAIGTYVGIDTVDKAALITTLTDLRTQMNLILARIRAATGHGLIA